MNFRNLHLKLRLLFLWFTAELEELSIFLFAGSFFSSIFSKILEDKKSSSDQTLQRHLEN